MSCPRCGRTWWAHFEFTRINTTPTILRKKIEDLRGVGAFAFHHQAGFCCRLVRPDYLKEPAFLLLLLLSQLRRTWVQRDSMRNPLAETAASDAEGRELVCQAQDGNRDALELLITRHQRWIYNIVLRMVYLPQDAEDATQEILVKLIKPISIRRQPSASMARTR